MKIIFRCDGGFKNGMGHVVRCSVLAKELIKRKHEVLFVTKKDKTIKRYLHTQKIKAHFIHSTAPKSLLKADLVVLDTYSFSESTLKKIPSKILLMLDSIPNFRLEADAILLPHTLKPHLKLKQGAYKLYGPRYVLLKPEFKKAPAKKKHGPTIHNVLINFGGSDKENVTTRMALYLNQYKRKLNLTFLLGASFSSLHFKKLKAALKKSHHHIHFLKNITNVAPVMRKNDIAIASPSTVAYELCRVGIPTLTVLTADNQKIVQENIKGTVIALGNYQNLTAKQLLSGIGTLEKQGVRQSLSKKASRLFDGHGPSRVANAIETLIKKPKKHL
ncbi:UDP-2,4-diacetamido-2,4,6-trideoxy-beta-L-altropyranose hydrolase [bacterium]|nr:UDP-2,4-diacetamido-2,4,6-trideoxy-beta-L-altropyranose hydrolase [bacterium]